MTKAPLRLGSTVMGRKPPSRATNPKTAKAIPTTGFSSPTKNGTSGSEAWKSSVMCGTRTKMLMMLPMPPMAAATASSPPSTPRTWTNRPEEAIMVSSIKAIDPPKRNKRSPSVARRGGRPRYMARNGVFQRPSSPAISRRTERAKARLGSPSMSPVTARDAASTR